MRRLLRVTSLLALVGVLAVGEARSQSAGSNAPFTLQQIISLLQGRWTGVEILAMVREDCISFSVTGAAEEALRRAGAGQALLTGLRAACNSTNRERQPAPRAAAQPQGVINITGELPPEWSRIVNQLPPSNNRTITLTPGRAATIIVTAPGWCPDRIDVTLRSGETRPWTPNLRGRPWVGAC
jgi:hypothetical protein